MKIWLALFEQGDQGEQMLHATLDVEDALMQFRDKLEGVEKQ